MWDRVAEAEGSQQAEAEAFELQGVWWCVPRGVCEGGGKDW